MNVEYVLKKVLTLGYYSEPKGDPTPKEIAENELLATRVSLLEHRKDLEFRKHMVNALEERESRLLSYLQKDEGERPVSIKKARG